jgi:hypothetical protein
MKETTSITLMDNQVAVFDFNTREVDIVTIDNLDEVEDLEEALEQLGYNTSQIAYMA